MLYGSRIGLREVEMKHQHTSSALKGGAKTFWDMLQGGQGLFWKCFRGDQTLIILLTLKWQFGKKIALRAHILSFFICLLVV